MISEEQHWKNWPGFGEISTTTLASNFDTNESQHAQIETQPKETGQREEIEKAKSVEQLVMVDQREDNTDTESEQLPFHLLVPPNDQSPENIPEVKSLKSSQNNSLDDCVGYKLPFRHNRGKPPNCYSPDHGERKQNYPIANHVST